MIELSVIICTYNPDENILINCLQFLAASCKHIDEPEIIIVDNNSTPPIESLQLKDRFAGQFKRLRVVCEPNQGLTPARLKGINESTGNLLVFIDDDNFISEQYLNNGIKIALENPHIGAWSGQVKLLFETPPELWTRKYWGLLVHREFETDKWSNLPLLAETMPCGAGLFVRREVAEYYNNLHVERKRLIQLDRTGNSLFSAGDNDLAACACDIGLGIGLYTTLILEHFIPKRRIQRKYLLQLAEAISASAIIFKSFRGNYPNPKTLKNKIANTIRLFLKNRIDRQFYLASLRGEREGERILKHQKTKI